MFRQTGGFDKLLDKTTSHLLMEPDWPSILQICDLIRQNDVQPRYALSAVKKKLFSQNPHTAMFAVQLLESMVKNCGSSLHDELTTRAYCDGLHDLIKNTQHENVRQKMLELVQAWNFAFRKNTKYSALKDTMNLMKAEGYKFPVMRESDAMFSADSAPVWADGEVCHHCRTQFTLVLRKHHCRACGQVFCAQCSSKLSTLPKFGIEKEVRVCDACFDAVNKPQTSVVGKDPDMEEYMKSSLAQQSQAPPRKTEEEIREEEELQLALALSQSEAEHKEKEKMRATSAYFNYKGETQSVQPERTESPIDQNTAPELALYLNRSYWEKKSDNIDHSTASPSAPATAPSILTTESNKVRENGITDNEIDEFVKTLKSQVEIFINRMKSNSSRGRSIANDSSVQTLFLNITAMHSRLLRYIQQHDDSRLYYERLQDKLTQVKDARAALDALREEHREKLRQQAEEAERQRQMLMAQKLDIMRKKKQEYLQYQRQVALQRIQEQEREMQMRQEQQKQQYMTPQFYMGSPIHGQQFPPNAGPPGNYGYQYGQQAMMGAMGGPPPQGNMPPHMGHPPNSMPHQMQGPPGFPPQNRPPNMQGMPPHSNMPLPPGMPPPNMQMNMPPHQNVPANPNMSPLQMQNMMQNPNMPPHMQPNQNMPNQGIPGNPGMPPPQQNPNLPQQHGIQMGGNMQQFQQQSPQQQQPGAPPASPQAPAPVKSETDTAELISFD